MKPKRQVGVGIELTQQMFVIAMPYLMVLRYLV
jgi:hypothetical protein